MLESDEFVTPDKAKKTEQRQRVYAHRKKIMDLVHAGWSGRNIRTELGLEDVPESSFYYNLKTLKREAMTATAIITAELERLAGAEKPRPVERTSKAKVEAAARETRNASAGSVAVSAPKAEKQSQGESPNMTAVEETSVDMGKSPRPKRKIRFGEVGGPPKGQRPLDPQKRK